MDIPTAQHETEADISGMRWKISAVWKMLRLTAPQRCEVVVILEELGQSPPASDWRCWIKKGGYEVLVESNAAKHVFLVHDLNHVRSEEHTSELQSLMRISYAVFCLKKKKIDNKK